MKYRRLGMWGVKLSEIGFGSWLTLRQARTRSRPTALHHEAYENGASTSSTRPTCTGAAGAEELVGAGTRPRSPRDTYVLATKVFWPFQPDWPFPGGQRPRPQPKARHGAVRRVPETSGHRLHRPLPVPPLRREQAPLLETCRAMNDLIDQRQGDLLGASASGRASQISDAVATCDDHGLAPTRKQPAALQHARAALGAGGLSHECARLGLGIVNFSPLAEGALTGKYNRRHPGRQPRRRREGRRVRPAAVERGEPRPDSTSSPRWPTGSMPRSRTSPWRGACDARS